MCCRVLPPQYNLTRKAIACLHSLIPIRADRFAVGMVNIMKIKRQMIAFLLVIVQLMLLTACAEVPDYIDRDGVTVANDNTNIVGNRADGPNASNNSISSPVLKTPAEENLEIITTSADQHVELELIAPNAKKLCVDANVEVTGITQVSKYNYVLVPVSDELRQNLFAARFGDRASEFEYDELNNVWTLSNLSSITDYYLYNTYYPMAGESVPGEESFSLEYRKVNLYPFDDNLLESVSSSTVTLSLDDVISLCDQLVGAIANLEDYTVDYVHAYGTNGRRPYYKLVYKRVLDGMPVTGYNDLIFLVDSDGVEKVYGSIFDFEEVRLQEPIISAEAAVAVLSSNIAQVSFGESEMLAIGKITLEYLVSQNMMSETSIIPVWRFWLGDTEDQMNLNRGKILAVDAVTSELIQGERGHTF